MVWATCAEQGPLKVATAFVAPGDGQADHAHPEHQVLYLARGRLRVTAASLQGGVDRDAPAEFRFLPGELHGWEAITPAVVFSLWERR